MSHCMLCFPFTHNEADFAVTFGKDDKTLKVCRYCQQDLTLLGFNANQIIRLTKPLKCKVVARFWFLGAVQNLLEASKK